MGIKEESARVVMCRGYADAMTPLHCALGPCVTCKLPVWGNASNPSMNGEYKRFEYIHYSCQR